MSKEKRKEPKMKMKKLLAAVLATAMTLTMGFSAFARTVPSGKGGQGTITIENASKGIHYTVTKIFDATYNTKTHAVAYTYSETMSENDYFAQDANTRAITVKDAGKDASGNLNKDAATWLKNNISGEVVVNAVEATDGSSMVIKGLQYGYYLISSDLGTGTVLSVDTTKPDATMYDKNVNNPHFDDEQGKKVDDDNVEIGQTVTYTIDFTATNYVATGSDAQQGGKNAKKVGSYVIEDTLPDYLDDVHVKSIIVNDGTEHYVKQQFSNKKITIAWVDGNKNSLYNNNAVVTITYTATVTKDASIAGDGNKNKVTITPKDINDEDIPDVDKLEDEETVKTYAIAIKKVDDKGNALEGAKFRFPFYAEADPDNEGEYFVDITAQTQQTDIVTPEDGVIVIKGLKAQKNYQVEEIAAPAGYNKLAGPVTVTATLSNATRTSVTKYIDAEGNVTDEQTEVTVDYSNDNIHADAVFVVNKTGVELPATGGMGTTIFYVLGSLLVIGAGIVLVAKRRMDLK